MSITAYLVRPTRPVVSFTQLPSQITPLVKKNVQITSVFQRKPSSTQVQQGT